MLYQAGQATQELFDINPDTGDNYATMLNFVSIVYITMLNFVSIVIDYSQGE